MLIGGHYLQQCDKYSIIALIVTLQGASFALQFYISNCYKVQGKLNSPAFKKYVVQHYIVLTTDTEILVPSSDQS
jgi:hypothetical protein